MSVPPGPGAMMIWDPLAVLDGAGTSCFGAAVAGAGAAAGGVVLDAACCGTGFTSVATKWNRLKTSFRVARSLLVFVFAPLGAGFGCSLAGCLRSLRSLCQSS